MAARKQSGAPPHIEPWIERLSQINQMRAEGKTGPEIAALFAVSVTFYSHVLRWLSCHGYKVTDPPHSTHPQGDNGSALLARMEEIRSFMMQGLSVKIMARKLGRTPSAIANDIVCGATDDDRSAWRKAKRDVRASKRTPTQRRGPKSANLISEAQLRQVADLLPLMAQGMTWDEISSSSGRTLNAVKSAIYCGATPEQKAAWKKAREAREVAVSQGEK